MLNFQDQAAKDLDAVFFNALAPEFVIPVKIKGIKGLVSPEFVCSVVVDRERYVEQRISARSENVTLMWDNISLRVYGAEKLMHILIDANPEFREHMIFPANCELVIPEIPRGERIDFPPWRAAEFKILKNS